MDLMLWSEVWHVGVEVPGVWWHFGQPAVCR